MFVEYKVEIVRVNEPKRTEDALNRLGDQGWELVAIVSAGARGFYSIFKRETERSIPTTPEPPAPRSRRSSTVKAPEA